MSPISFPHWQWLGWRALAALIGGLILRLWMMRAFPQVSGDALIYGTIARNLLQHGTFAIGTDSIHPTLIRLPGYPLFLATCFRVFGIENYNAVGYFQIALELFSCLLLADFVRNISTDRAGLNALWLAAMCPFTAVFSGAPLTESPTFDAICLALWSLDRYLTRRQHSILYLLLFTLALSSAALFRPDGALLAFALWPALFFARATTQSLRPMLSKALIAGVLAVLPFAFWAVRNWQVFHVFEPLAPRYANDPGEDPHLGWQHWVKTWCLDFTCTYNIYWNVPDDTVDLNDLPSWVFDSPAQKAETEQIFAIYNRNPDMPPELDVRFAALARERAHDHPIRTMILMPLGRLADMTFRPRVENLTIDLKWWQYHLHRSETRFSIVYGVVNLLFLGLGIYGLFLKPRYWQYMVAYLVLRCLLLLTIEAPETRYTLEFFPFLFATGGISLQHIFRRRSMDALTR
ncbi:ArnT family glycosyltransferase [Acidicapsa dinghuensis]|uniref:ArnT family glycosyltransferase n=1 Tax=Acidicapsa dinghuensis TaxID=2218256 RepID=A0ABW1EH91_9BACT|nr:glycosyltransferase family 39 protein [Acidicapsa dinghuensis]